ncbi:hypothetical protein GCM10028818_33190 [Spirosoma horti]
MEPIVVLTGQQVKELIDRYELVTARLVEADRELQALRSEKFVGIDWIASLWSVDPDTARKMIQVLATGPNRMNIKVLSFGPKIVRYRKSDIQRLTDSNLVQLKDMLIQKRARKKVR